MLKFYIDDALLEKLDYVRVALSEANLQLRLRALENLEHEINQEFIQQFLEQDGGANLQDPENNAYLSWIAQTAGARTEAFLEFSETMRRYEERNQRPLNVAEDIGIRVFNSIQDKSFCGLHSKTGLLEGVRHEAKKENARGAKDMDSLRSHWGTYRGVVHLGMAISYCQDYPEQNQQVLDLADLFRKQLSTHCPKGTAKPYVDPSEQIIFRYTTKPSGPRFANRGLPPKSK